MFIHEGYYWIATKVVDYSSNRYYFSIKSVGNRELWYLCFNSSSAGASAFVNSEASLFPIITLNVNNIEGNATEGYGIK